MKETLDRLRAFAGRLTSAVEAVGDADLRRLERPGGWSVLDVVAHLGDLEMVYAVRMRDILAGAGDRTLQPLPQNEWIERVHRRDETLAELLEQFAFHRRMNLALFDRLSEDELSRSGLHPQYGAITPHDIAARLERHDEKHLAQIERIKATHRATSL
jgi:hypothetical protein